MMQFTSLFLDYLKRLAFYLSYLVMINPNKLTAMSLLNPYS